MAVSAAGARVVIADDQPDIRLLLSTCLRLDPGLDVVGEAANGAEVISKVGELKPQALILDLQMPVMSGEEAIPILRSLAPELRILVFSAYVGLHKDLGGSERPDAELAKGCDLRLLVQELRRLLEYSPPDIVGVDLGLVDTAAAQLAMERWTALGPGLRDTALAERQNTDLLALLGVFLTIEGRLAEAAAQDLVSCHLRFTTRLAAGQAARRALTRLQPDLAAGLEPLWSPLLGALPSDPPEGLTRRASPPALQPD